MATLDNDIRPLWQEGRMRRTADGCDFFLDSFMNCRKHWTEIHTEFVFGFQCPLCCFSNRRRNQMTRHMSRIHPNTPTEGLEPSTFRNKKYKNREGGLMPMRKVTDRRKQCRDQETIRRRRMVEGLDTPLVREDTNSREQIVYAYEMEK